MKIVTYNVNSINARLENLLDFLRLNSPDIVLLQEIKTEFSGFPFFEIKAAGYEAKILGQKSYNGVAILSREKIEITAEGLPDFPDENARYLEAVIEPLHEEDIQSSEILIKRISFDIRNALQNKKLKKSIKDKYILFLSELEQRYSADLKKSVFK